jgi:hypothetical protein
MQRIPSQTPPNVAPSALSCFTIGHSSHTFEEFSHLLQLHGIDTVVDVRSTPYSKRVPQFNRETLQLALRDLTIGYAYMGDNLGARYTDPRLIASTGRVDLVKVAQRQEFRLAVRSVFNAIAKGRRVALMCSEGDPFDCHRFVLVSHAVQASGVSVYHIMPGGELQTNHALEDRLLSKYYPERDEEPGLFPTETHSREELVEMAYVKRAADIGYRVGESEEEKG